MISEPPPSDVCAYDPGFVLWWDGGLGQIYLQFVPNPAAGQWIRVWFSAHRPLAEGSPPLPMRSCLLVVFPLGSPVGVVVTPPLVGADERHWVRAQAGDEYGLASFPWSNFVDT